MKQARKIRQYASVVTSEKIYSSKIQDGVRIVVFVLMLFLRPFPHDFSYAHAFAYRTGGNQA